MSRWGKKGPRGKMCVQSKWGTCNFNQTVRTKLSPEIETTTCHRDKGGYKQVHPEPEYGSGGFGKEGKNKLVGKVLKGGIECMGGGQDVRQEKRILGHIRVVDGSVVRGQVSSLRSKKKKQQRIQEKGNGNKRKKENGSRKETGSPKNENSIQEIISMPLKNSTRKRKFRLNSRTTLERKTGANW